MVSREQKLPFFKQHFPCYGHRFNLLFLADKKGKESEKNHPKKEIRVA